MQLDCKRLCFCCCTEKRTENFLYRVHPLISTRLTDDKFSKFFIRLKKYPINFFIWNLIFHTTTKLAVHLESQNSQTFRIITMNFKKLRWCSSPGKVEISWAADYNKYVEQKQRFCWERNVGFHMIWYLDLFKEMFANAFSVWHRDITSF